MMISTTTSYTVLICTQCKREEREDAALDWIRTDRAGLNAACFGDLPLDGLFCSVRCLVSYFGEAATAPNAPQPVRTAY